MPKCHCSLKKIVSGTLKWGCVAFPQCMINRSGHAIYSSSSLIARFSEKWTKRVVGGKSHCKTRRVRASLSLSVQGERFHRSRRQLRGNKSRSQLRKVRQSRFQLRELHFCGCFFAEQVRKGFFNFFGRSFRKQIEKKLVTAKLNFINDLLSVRLI